MRFLRAAIGHGNRDQLPIGFPQVRNLVEGDVVAIQANVPASVFKACNMPGVFSEAIQRKHLPQEGSHAPEIFFCLIRAIGNGHRNPL